MSEQLESVRLEVERRILEELKEQETLKKEILNDLNPKGKIIHFFQHPAVLLLMGFLLTSVLGAGLSIYWQHEEWVRQQSLLARKQALDQKYELANDIAKAIGDMHAASSGVLSAVTITNEEGIKIEELSERTKYWYQVKQNWLINSSIYLQKLTVHFPVDSTLDEAKQARSIFETVIDERKRVNNKILNLVKALESNGYKPTPEQSQKAQDIVKELNDMKQGAAKQLMQVIAKKIQEESNP